jgi:hypothetical protein
MQLPWRDSPGERVVYDAFMIAAETGGSCRPIHLLGALSALDGPFRQALRPTHGGPLLPPAALPLPVSGGGASYLMMQAQQAAGQLASRRNQIVGPEHLLFAVVDQAEPEAVRLLIERGLELGTLRSVALHMLGAAPDRPPATMPPLTPAGTLDRPPLPVAELDPTAWAALVWRQQHLPVDRLRVPTDWISMYHVERHAAGRVAARLDLDDDQRASLHVHHVAEVERRAALAAPIVVETREQLIARYRQHGPDPRRPFEVWWQRNMPRWSVGWPTWFANRGVGLREKRFRLITLRRYRDAPRLAR